MPRPTPRRRPRTAQAGRRSTQMVFTRQNYILMLAGVAAVVIGYVIMRMDNQVDGFISLYVAPLLILAGYLEVIYAIMWQPREKSAA